MIRPNPRTRANKLLQLVALAYSHPVLELYGIVKPMASIS